jgi:hypothetical protein
MSSHETLNRDRRTHPPRSSSKK